MRRNTIRLEGGVAFMALERRDGSLVCEAILDASDVEKALSHSRRWCAHWDPTSRKYRVTSTGGTKGKQYGLVLARFLLDAPRNRQVDHINHDPLDNRRVNLRLVTGGENCQNKAGARSDSRTGIRGVYRSREGGYIAHVTVNGRRKNHRCRTLKDAKVVVKRMRRELMPASPDVRGRSLVSAKGWKTRRAAKTAGGNA